MRANAKYLVTSMLLLFPISANAQTEGEPSSEAPIDVCQQLAELNPNFIQTQLNTYSENVLGKPAIEWTIEDFVNLNKNLTNCNGLPAGTEKQPKVIIQNWKNPLEASANTILPINSLNKVIKEAYQPVWDWGTLPSCQVIIKWKREPIWYTDNSEELFGKSFRDLNTQEAATIKGFIKECSPVGLKILELNRMNQNDFKKILEDLDKSINREVAAGQEDKEYLAPSLRIYHNGKRIPLAYLSPTSKKWVEFVNKYEKNDRTMRVDDMVNVSRWTTAVMDRRRDDAETEYAKAVKEIIAKRTFNGGSN